MLEWITETAVSLARYTAEKNAEWTIYNDLIKNNTVISNYLTMQLSESGYEFTLISSFFSLIALYLLAFLITVIYICFPNKKVSTRRCHTSVSDEYEPEDKIPLLWCQKSSKHGIHRSVFRRNRILFSVLAFFFLAMLFCVALLCLTANNVRRDSPDLVQGWQDARKDMFTKSYLIADQLDGHIVPKMLEMQRDIHNVIKFLPRKIMQPFGTLMNAYMKISKFVKQLPDMIGGLSRMSIALDHLFVIEGSLNATLIKRVEAIVLLLDNCTQESVCRGDPVCDDLLLRAVNASDSIRILDVYSHTPILYEGIVLATNAQHAIEAQMANFDLASQSADVSADINKLISQYTTAPLRRLNSRVDEMSNDLRKMSLDIRKSSYDINSNISSAITQTSNILTSVNVYLLIIPVAYALFSCFSHICLVSKLMPSDSKDSGGGCGGKGIRRYRGGDNGSSSSSDDDSGNSNSCGTRTAVLVVRFFVISLFILVTCIASLFLCFPYTKLVYLDTTLCLHDRHTADPASALKAVFAAASKFSTKTSYLDSATTVQPNFGFQVDSTWSRVIDAVLSSSRFTEHTDTAEQVRGFDFWRMYDACSLSSHSSAFSSDDSPNSGGGGGKVLSVFDAFSYATNNHNLFNITGLTSIKNYRVEILKQRITVNTTLGDIEVLSPHTWIKSRIAGEFMKSFDTNYYRNLLNSSQFSQPISEYAVTIRNFTSQINDNKSIASIHKELSKLEDEVKKYHDRRLRSEVFLRKGVNSVEEPISFPIEEQVDILMRQQKFLKKRGNSVINDIVNNATRSVYQRLDDYSTLELRRYITKSLGGGCETFPRVYDAFVSNTCERIVHKYQLYTTLIYPTLVMSLAYICIYIIACFSDHYRLKEDVTDTESTEC